MVTIAHNYQTPSTASCYPASENLFGNKNIGDRQTERSESKITKRGEEPFGVLGVEPDPDIEVLGVARVPMKGNGISADYQVADFMLV
jgi:hypothetical protein